MLNSYPTIVYRVIYADPPRLRSPVALGAKRVRRELTEEAIAGLSNPENLLAWHAVAQLGTRLWLDLPMDKP